MTVAVFETETMQTYTFADDIPEVAFARQQERDAAEQLLSERRHQYEVTGEVDYQPVDALSTAAHVLALEREYGEKSWQCQQARSGLVLDCQRLVGEWYRKKKPEYFPPTRHVFDAEKEEFFSHGLSVRQMTENALTPFANNEEEEQRRINERVEDATPQIMRSLGKIALGEQVVRTVSECTDKAINDYAEDQANGRPHAGYNGYVPEIQKLMIRDIRLDTTSEDRFEEQIALPGIYITHEIIQMTLAERGLDAAQTMGKTELHGSQIIANDDIVDFVKELDAVASEQWCTNIFMGEEVPDGYQKNYDNFREEALQRQEKLKGYAETVALFVLDLAEQDFDRQKAPAHVEDFVKDILLGIAAKDETVAEQMFDEKTAALLKKATCYEKQGRFAEAQLALEAARETAPGGGFCGAGSCGLEGVVANSKEDTELRKKLGADSSDTVVKDKERACRCGKKSIVYAYNKSKVTKLCESCGAFESKHSKVA